jgi:DedD protein
MDAALKQRLVGAAVLVALAVIFLPMLVGGPEPESESVSVPLDIPAAPERDFETRDLPLTPSAPAAATPAADDPNRIVTVDAPSAERVDAAPESEPSTASATPAAAATPAAPSPQPVTEAESKAAETAPAAPPTTPTPAATNPAVTPGGRYVVNLGSYGNAANAQALITALKSAGLPAFAEPISVEGKPAQRLRLGPYAQRGEAEAARLTVTRLRSDLAASVVALDEAAAASAPVVARAPVASGFAVQLGALASESDANTLRARARSAGFTAFVERVVTDNGPLWRVRVGPEVQRANAEKLKAQIANKLQIDGVIVSHP